MKPSDMRRLFQRCACERCFYCDTQFSRHEHDHYPIPKAAGGTQVVAACLDCHDFKDRIPLDNWEVGPTFAAYSELLKEIDMSQFRGLSDQALFDAIWKRPELKETAIMARWSSLTPLTKVLYAKLRAMRELDLYEMHQRE